LNIRGRQSGNRSCAQGCRRYPCADAGITSLISEWELHAGNQLAWQLGGLAYVHEKSHQLKPEASAPRLMADARTCLPQRHQYPYLVPRFALSAAYICAPFCSTDLRPRGVMSLSGSSSKPPSLSPLHVDAKDQFSHLPSSTSGRVPCTVRSGWRAVAYADCGRPAIPESSTTVTFAR
jgi:hypothetical protein